MRVRTDDQDGFFGLRTAFRDPRQDLFVFNGAEDAMIERDEDLTRAGTGGSGGLEYRHSRTQRPMDASGLFVTGRAPHAVINANGRCNVSPGKGEMAAALGCFNLHKSIGLAG